MTPPPAHILILGASYGSLLGLKLVLAGHDVTLVCLPEEAALIASQGVRVRLPLRGHDGLVEIDSRDAPGRLTAAAPGAVDPVAFDLVALAMQEPQYRAPAVRALIGAIARSGTPTMSIMNMAPLPYLARLPGLDLAQLRGCYSDPTVWDGFDPAQMTLASPDPQAFRPLGEPVNVLQVSLPTNFKVAGFARAADTALLARLCADIDAVRWQGAEVPVKLRLHDSVFVPLAKWAMLLTGNYRCVTAEGPRSIAEAVGSDPDLSAEVYAWVCRVCIGLGAAPDDLVPFQKYAAAATGLAKPSSAARALFAGAPNIERLDLIVQTIAAGMGMRHPEVDRTIALVNTRLDQNRAAAA